MATRSSAEQDRPQPNVHALLNHLAARGFALAPKALSTGPDGREVGEVAEAEGGSAEVFEAAFDRFGGSVAGAGRSK